MRGGCAAPTLGLGKPSLPVDQLHAELLNPLLRREGPKRGPHCPQSRPEVSQDVRLLACDFREGLSHSHFIAPPLTHMLWGIHPTRALMLT